MGRKRKQIDPEGESKSSLPPCRVCDAPGAGFHYGANTCEACKGFFHRSLKISHHYKCEGNGNCIIEHGRTRLCQFCRYNKCLFVGMAKEAIKTGRYTSVKRTSDILEVKRLKAQKTEPFSPFENGTNSKIPGVGSDDGSDNSLDYDSQSAHSSFLFGKKIGQISLASGVQTKSEPSEALFLNRASCLAAEVSQRSCLGLCGQTLQELENQCPKTSALIDNFVKREASPAVSILHEMESLFSESPDEHSCIQTHHLQHCNPQNPSSMSPLSVTSPYGSPQEGSIIKPNMLADVTSSIPSLSVTVAYSSSSSSSAYTASTSLHSPSSSTSVYSPAVSLISPTSITASPTSSFTNVASSSSSLSNLDMQMYISDSPNSNCETECERSVLDLYRDKDNIVKILLDADENYVVPLASKISEEEIQRQQKEHFEACKLQQEMFGQLRRLPDHEYDFIFATTGLDMDDRQMRLCVMGAGLEKVIRAMVKFCKSIPGFSWLDISDKVKLIKYSRQEFCMFTIYKYMNSERKIMRTLDGLWKCENEISRMSTNSDSNMVMENLELHFKFCSSLQKLKLSDEELVVIRAIIIMAPDRNPHVDSPLARDIYWQLNECLIHVLSRRYPNPLIVYARIMGKLTESRTQTENMVRFFKRLKIDKYSNVKDNPLLREMCSGIFFDENEDECANINS